MGGFRSEQNLTFYLLLQFSKCKKSSSSSGYWASRLGIAVDTQYWWYFARLESSGLY